MKQLVASFKFPMKVFAAHVGVKLRASTPKNVLPTCLMSPEDNHDRIFRGNDTRKLSHNQAQQAHLTDENAYAKMHLSVSRLRSNNLPHLL